NPIRYPDGSHDPAYNDLSDEDYEEEMGTIVSILADRGADFLIEKNNFNTGDRALRDTMGQLKDRSPACAEIVLNTIIQSREVGQSWRPDIPGIFADLNIGKGER